MAKLSVSPRPLACAFSRARARASSEMSVARTFAPSISLAQAIEIAPVPVPISTTKGFSIPFRASFAISTRDSVSGRGISARGSHLMTNPRKLVSPMMCCKGSRFPRRATSGRKMSSSAGVRGFSKFRYRSIRFFILRPWLMMYWASSNGSGTPFFSKKALVRFKISSTVICGILLSCPA